MFSVEVELEWGQLGDVAGDGMTVGDSDSGECYRIDDRFEMCSFRCSALNVSC